MREAREKRQLTLQQASDTTKVRTHYLQALEDDDLSAMSSVAQARGFLRIYAEFLGLQVADLVPAAAPVPAPAPAAAPPTYVEPKAAPETDLASGSKQPRPSLFDNVRELLGRGGKPEAASATAQPASSTDTTGNDESVAAEPAENAPKAAKKKGARQSRAKSSRLKH